VRDHADAYLMKKRNSFVHLADEIAGYMRELSPPSEAWLGVLQTEWATLVGEPVAAHSRPTAIEHHTVCVNVDSHAWLAELRSGLNALIEGKLRTRTHGEITRIRWQLGSIGTQRNS
jgi:predicted nucleic acid-binding Zn ribbon protein